MAFFDRSLHLIERRAMPSWHFDPRFRPWYRAARQDKKSVHITDPYLDFSTQEPTVSFARRLKQGQGVIGVDTDLSAINALFKHADITGHSQLALLNRDGRVVSWYGGEKLQSVAPRADNLLPFLDQLPSAVLATFYQQRRNTGQGPFQLAFDAAGQRWQGEFAALPVHEHATFSLILASPFNELLRETLERQHKSFSVIFFTQLVLLVFGIGLALWFARIASRPLWALMREANKIERFDFVEPIQVTSNILEITQLASAMDRMKSTICRFLDLSRALSEQTHFSSLLTSVLQDMQESSEASGGIIYLADEEMTVFTPVKASWNQHFVDEVDLDTIQAIHFSWACPHPVSQMLLEQTRTSEVTKRTIDTWFQGLPCDIDKMTMLVLPLSSGKRERVGVLVLFIDAHLSSITPERLAFTQALSHSAAVALYTQYLLKQQKKLLSSFIEVIAGAIDAKSTHTGWHCRRLPVIVELLAQAACRQTTGPLADFKLTDEGWEALKTAAWLHDCGKVTTPEHVIDKGAKLETLYNRIHEIRMRFEVIKREAEIACWKAIAHGAEVRTELKKCEALHQQLLDEFRFVASCNLGTEAMSEEAVARLSKIGQRTWWRTLPDDIGLTEEERQRKEVITVLPVEEKLLADKPEHRIERPKTQRIPEDNPWGFCMAVPQYLYHHGELHNLSIRHGTLTEEERYKINEHILQTIMMLEKLPFPESLKRVPEIAGNHHERVDGTGYPRRLTGQQMSIEARIIAIADIFEALTAADRPYKTAKPLSETLQIMRRMSDTGHIDPDLFELFMRAKVYEQYAERFMKGAHTGDTSH